MPAENATQKKGGFTRHPAKRQALLVFFFKKKLGRGPFNLQSGRAHRDHEEN